MHVTIEVQQCTFWIHSEYIDQIPDELEVTGFTGRGDKRDVVAL